VVAATSTLPADGRWTLRALAPPDRADGWRDVVDRTHLSWQVGDPVVDLGRPFDAAVRRSRFADVDLLECRCDPCSGSRGRFELGATDGESWAARLLPRGTLATVLLTAQLHALGGRPGIAGGDLAARVVGDVVSGCISELTSQPADGPAGDGAVRRATAERRAALRWAVTAHVERRLAEVARGRPLRPGELTPQAIAAAHTVSVRALQLLFEGTGTSLSAHVRTLRLEGARSQLIVDGRRTVAAIAATWGFLDAPHFSRAYRAQFGESPSETAARGRV
jgi:AraC family transcriptional regulator, positive regulator of tynA and feaB